MSEKIKTAVMEVIKAHMDGEDNNTKAVLSDVMESVNEILEQQPCDDAISREAAINIASLHCLTIDETIKALERLPSVTQKPIECDDAISRDAVKELIKSGVSTDTYDDVEQVCKWIDEIPSVTQKSGKWIPIPDNATNGDYVKAIMKAGMIHSVLFEENAKVDDEEFVCMYYEGKIIGDFDLTWWDAPYQKGGK